MTAPTGTKKSDFLMSLKCAERMVNEQRAACSVLSRVSGGSGYIIERGSK